MLTNSLRSRPPFLVPHHRHRLVVAGSDMDTAMIGLEDRAGWLFLDPRRDQSRSSCDAWQLACHGDRFVH
jgi:hypothetical protein